MRPFLYTVAFLSSLLSLPSYAQSKDPWLLKADSLIQIAAYEEATDLMQEQKKAANSQIQLKSYLNKEAEALVLLGKLQRSYDIGKESLAIDSDAQEAVSLNVQALLTIALAEVGLGKGQDALNTAKQALSISESQTGASPLLTAQALGRLGLIYWSLDSDQEALSYYRRALAIYRSLPNNQTSLDLAGLYNDMGLALAESKAEEARTFYRDALQIYQQSFGEIHPKVANSYLNLGYLDRQEEKYEQAMEKGESALRIWRDLYDKVHPNEAFVSSFIGQIHADMENWGEALSQQQQALIIYQEAFGDRHPKVAQTHNLIAGVQTAVGRHKEALKSLQEALISNSPSFNDRHWKNVQEGIEYYDPIVFLNTLLLKAQSFEGKHYSKSLKMADLQHSLQLLMQCSDLIDEQRQLRNSRADKIALGTVATSVYARGIRLCLSLAEISMRPGYYREQAFYFAEKGKAAVLLNAIADTKAKAFANIPAAQLEQEQELKAQILLVEQELSKLSDPSKEASYRKQLADLQQSYQAFIENLEEKYPEYYNLKYNNRALSVGEIQSMMPDSSALISYFVAEEQERLYAFVIRKQKYEVWDIPLADKFKKRIEGFRKGLTFQLRGAWQLFAEELYQQLLPKWDPKGINHLWVVPDGLLGSIPFEALLSQKSEESSPVSELPFLIKQHAISYVYATGILSQSNLRGERPKPQHALLCAPINFASRPNDNTQDFLNDLPGTKNEVENLYELLQKQKIKSSILLESAANEGVFKSTDLKQYDLLHLATHGLVDQASPDASEVFLYPSAQEDGHLRAGEIYNLQTKADLVVFSACETGLGKITAGEGIIGLSRALLYAGANNVVVSLWSGSDASTASLMTHFYTDLSQSNQPYHQAIRQAKLKLITSGEYSSPFFWSPFILLGY